MKRLKEKHPHLQPPFGDLPFAASTLNLGPRTVTTRHKDSKNLSFGLCAIVALGEFDAKKGGRLRLEEAKVELEFAPGDIILIPSACVTHYNTDIGRRETRSSLTFYSAGQLVRWVKDGCRPVSSLNAAEKAEVIKRGEETWKEGWSLYRQL